MFDKPIVIALVGAMMALASACASTPQKLNKEEIYEKDLHLVINGLSYLGVAVVPVSPHYDITVYAPRKADADFILFKSCNRQIKKERQGKKVVYRYTPIAQLENVGDCPLEIILLDGQGRHGWAWVIPATEEFQMTGYTKCNGTEGATQFGVSACQSASGLIQYIRFPSPVSTSPDSKCPVTPSIDNRAFTYRMPRGECAYVFQSQDGSQTHLHYSFGFDQHILDR